MQDRRLINAAIDGAGFDAHDEVDGGSRISGRLGHIGGQDRRIRQRLECGAADRHVQVLNLRRRRAVGVGRQSQLGAIRQREVLGLTDERHFMRSRNDRTSDVVIGDFQGRVLQTGRAVALHSQRILAKVQAGHEADQRIGRVARMKCT